MYVILVTYIQLTGTAKRQRRTRSYVSDRHLHAQYSLLYALLSCSILLITEHSNYNRLVEIMLKISFIILFQISLKISAPSILHKYYSFYCSFNNNSKLSNLTYTYS